MSYKIAKTSLGSLKWKHIIWNQFCSSGTLIINLAMNFMSFSFKFILFNNIFENNWNSKLTKNSANDNVTICNIIVIDALKFQSIF